MQNLKSLLNNRSIKEHNPTSKEINDILKLIQRDIKDAEIDILSNDRRFATAYNAALNLARIVTISEGYRIVAKIGHHKISFITASIILGKNFKNYFSLFEICRRKRNKVDYDLVDVATETELKELLFKVKNFNKLVYEWLIKTHTNFFI